MLRNAFDLLATEGTLKQLLRQLSFARTNQDQLRVIVDGTPNINGTVVSSVYVGNNQASMVNAANQPILWGNSAWNSVDARYAYGESLVGNYIQNRQRWTFS